MKKKQIRDLVIMASVAVLLAAGLFYLGFDQAKKSALRSDENAAKLPQYFAGVDFDGGEVTSELLKGHALTFVNIWATDCGPCIAEMPDLEAISQELSAKDVQFIGLCMGTLGGDTGDAMKEEARSILSETGVTYRCVFPSETFYNDFLKSTISSVPTTYLLDQSGTVIDKVSGSRSADDWREYLDELLAKQNGGQ